MGTVYRALRQSDYQQQVAIKVIRPGLDGGEMFRRFRTERQVLAELAHPHIARLLDGGSTEDGRPYFVMEYIDGRPLDRYCEEGRLGTRERVEQLLAVCAAAVNKAVFSRDGRLIVTGSQDETARLWSAATGQSLGSLCAMSARSSRWPSAPTAGPS
jgi:serine/threonine protein kinase